MVATRMKKSYEIAIPADSFARAVAFAISRPEDVDINEILFRPTWGGPWSEQLAEADAPQIRMRARLLRSAQAATPANSKFCHAKAMQFSVVNMNRRSDHGKCTIERFG
jgi:hypothetical protein